jgi:hypothetical protein
MGTWANDPWDNDDAADWYGDLMDRTKLREAWLEGIKQDPVDSPDVVRAAAALFVMLGRVYIWPIKDFDADLETAIAALSAVVAGDYCGEDAQLAQAVQQELGELISRRKPTEGGTVSNPESRKPWWKFW